MGNMKKTLIISALILFVINAVGCASIKDIFSKPEPTNAPTPTPTKSLDFYATATPSPKATATPTLAPPTPTEATKPTPTKKPTPPAYITNTPTPNIAYPTNTPTSAPMPTNMPTLSPTSKPTTVPTKAPTATPTPIPGKITANVLMNKLYESYPELMSTTCIMADVIETSGDDVINMSYTKYTNQESFENVTHESNDVWITSPTANTFKTDSIYTEINSSDVMTYTNYPEVNAKKWTKKKLPKDSVQPGVDVIPRAGIVSLINPRIVSSDPSEGYKIEMDCAVDLSEILSLITDGVYSRTFNKTFKGTAILDYETLQPVSFETEASEVNIATNYVLQFFRYSVDNIIDNISDFPELGDIKKTAVN
jgi:hypothetical protein